MCNKCEAIDVKTQTLVVVWFLKGGIFPENSADLINTFQNAVRVLNTANELLKLQAVTVTVDTNDSFEVQKAGSYRIISKFHIIL